MLPILILALAPMQQVAAGVPSPIAPASGSAMPFTEIPGEREFSGELIVRPRQDLGIAARALAQQQLAGVVRRDYPETGELVIGVAKGPERPGAAESRVAAQLMATGLFQYAHPNWTVYPVGVPNDPRFGEQWHHSMMQSPLAWDIVTGTTAVVVAVTDTGIITHADLTNRVSGYNAVSGVAEANGGVMTDIHGHGTHVAGCAAASGNNGVGVCGMGWNLGIMPIRVSEAASGGASFDALLSGARWAAEHGAKSVSASYSGIGYEAIETTGEYIRTLDASLLWAAGNSADDHAGWDFEHVIVVGASNSSDQRSSFSSYGRGVDLFAPGSSILSTTNDGGYGFASGTSMAAPVANGALGLIRAANPALSAAQAEYYLMHTCDAWGGAAETEALGFGRINLRKAVQAAVNASVPAAPVANADIFFGVTTVTMALDVLSNDYDPNMDALEIASCATLTSKGDALTVLPGAGIGGRDLVQLVPAPDATSGARTFSYQLREPVSGATANATVTVTLDQPRAPWAPAGATAGLRCSYYALTAPQALPNWAALTPYLVETVANVNYASTDGVYAGSGRADEVGAVYEGWVEVPTDGRWTFSITSDDGSRMRIGSTVIADNDGLHGMTTRSGTVALRAGKHPVRLEFFENGGGAGFQFKWSGPGRSTEIVPQEVLTQGGVASPGDLNGDGVTDGSDLGLLLGAWGSTGGADGRADIDGNGVVNGADLGLLLGSWG
ncbi:MAG: S8 family serine peptidase [Phycisphaerales bacterium]